MKEVIADIWDYPADYRCVTTNGIIMKNGELVMGGGIALQAKLRYPALPARLGKLVKMFGNKPFFFDEFNIISFPTKQDWKNDSIMELIESSAKDIAAFGHINSNKVIAMTRPGCGLGGLVWSDVKKVISPIFDTDQFVVCHYE